jgi:hypothetical protein
MSNPYDLRNSVRLAMNIWHVVCGIADDACKEYWKRAMQIINSWCNEVTKKTIFQNIRLEGLYKE